MTATQKNAINLVLNKAVVALHKPTGKFFAPQYKSGAQSRNFTKSKPRVFWDAAEAKRIVKVHIDVENRFGTNGMKLKSSEFEYLPANVVVKN